MKFTISSKVLAGILSRVSRATERRNTIPVLSYVKIKAGDGRIELCCTDLERNYAETATCNVAMPGSILVPVFDLAALLRHTPGDITLQSSSLNSVAAGSPEVCKLEAGKLQFTLPTQSVDDWPAFAAWANDGEFIIPATELLDMFTHVSFAISTELTRYYLNGIYMHAEDGLLKAVATDGHRMAIVQKTAPEGSEKIAGIVPRRSIQDFCNILAKNMGDVIISYSFSRMSIVADNITMSIKLIDGTFPDYKRVLPTNSGKHIWQLDPKETSANVKALRGGSKFSGIKIENGPSGLTLSSEDASRGTTGRAEQDAETTSTLAEIGFQSKYLIDVAAAIHGTMHMQFEDKSSPAKITDTARPESTFVLMPMRI